jgi:Cu-processing system permease protein
MMLPIAWITFRRITERSVLMQFGVLALVLVLIGLDLDLTAAKHESAVESGLTTVWIFLGFFTLFWTCIEIPREIARQEVNIYLSKPLSRARYIAGKFLGMAGLVLGVQAMLLTVFFLCLLTRPGHVLPSHSAMVASAQTALFLVLLCALCVPISLLLAGLPSLVAVLLIIAAGYGAFGLAVAADTDFFPANALLYDLAYYVVPNMLHYRWPATVTPDTTGYLASLAGYTLGWVVISLIVAHATISRRDLN